jgi:NarL family two-component system sensor histidine kinase LiaS
MMENISQERLRIAREIHDGIAQQIAAIGYQIDSIIGDDSLPPSARNELRRTRSALTLLGASVRDEIFQLRGLPTRSFSEVIFALGSELLEEVEIDLSIDVQEPQPQSHRFELIRIAQEAIINSKKHANATKISIIGSGHTLEISDNGNWSASERAGMWGIIGMKERAKQIGVRLEVENDEFGTRVIASW